MACLFAEDSEKKIAETLHWEARRVELDENFPEHEARDTGENTEDDIEGNTGAVANTSKDEASRCSVSQKTEQTKRTCEDLRATGPTQDIGSDQEED